MSNPEEKNYRLSDEGAFSNSKQFIEFLRKVNARR